MADISVLLHPRLMFGVLARLVKVDDSNMYLLLQQYKMFNPMALRYAKLYTILAFLSAIGLSQVGKC